MRLKTIKGVYLASLAIFLSVPVFTSAAQTQIIQRDVGSLITKFAINQSPGKLRAIATNNDESHYGFLFDDGMNVRVFRDGVKIYEGISSHCTVNPFLFWMTDDGHVVYVPDCTSLYFDDHLVSEDNLVLTGGKESTVYQNGQLIYPEGESILRFDPSTGQSTKLYEHPGEQIQFIRVRGSKIVYTTLHDFLRASIYSNGKKISPAPVSNPTNFLVTKTGDVYFFSERGSRFTLYKNKSRYLVGKGKGGFLFEDDKGGIWYVSYTIDNRTYKAAIFLGHNKERKNYVKDSIGNIEGFMAFDGDNFAARAQHKNDESFQLLKNGSFVGEDFSFDPNYKDYNGLFFAKNGKVYLRTYQDGRWLALEDGKEIFSNVFQNVWLIRKAQSGDVFIYGTK